MDRNLILKNLNTRTENTLMKTLGITYIDVGDDYLVASMPVNFKVHQPAGILHGGATVALAESVGSSAAHLSIDREKQEIRGLEITANHIRSVRSGIIRGIAKPIHKGRTTQLWEIKVMDEEDRLVSICKLTIIVLSKK